MFHVLIKSRLLTPFGMTEIFHFAEVYIISMAFGFWQGLFGLQF